MEKKEVIPFIDLKTQYRALELQINKRINAVLEHGQYIMGPEVRELEGKLADYVGVRHCITVSSGTDALLVAMMALGISQGDEVITTPFTFIATAEVIALLGAVPVFVDIDPRTYNMDSAKIEAAITQKTKVIMPVSLYGQCADFDAINAIALKHNLTVIEDAAQSFGATYKGSKSCSLSMIGCTSFFPSKPLGCYGDGGACFTNDDEVAGKMRQLRLHGQEKRYFHAIIGINGRLDTLQAAILLAKFDVFPDEVEARQRIGRRYGEKLIKSVQPYVAPYNTSVYGQYTIQLENRAGGRTVLEAAGIPVAVHYPTTLNLQPAFAYLGQPAGTFPVAEAAAGKVLSLPMHPYLSEQDQDQIISIVNKIVSQED